MNISIKDRLDFLDIGSNGGIQQKWKDMANYVNFQGFDAVNGLFINDISEPKKVMKKLYKDEISAYTPNTAFLSNFPNVKRYNNKSSDVLPASKVKSLDELKATHKIGNVDFIKIDTEGNELKVLQGAKNQVIPDLLGIEVEVQFRPIYLNAPKFHEIDRFLTERDFELIDIQKVHWKRNEFNRYRGKGQIIFGNAVYFKSFNSMPHQKHNKAILMCLVYRMFDFAITLCRQRKLEELEIQIKKEATKGIPPWLHLGPVHAYFNYILNQFSPPSHLGFSDMDRRIGNAKPY
jgi:hypothetical protein